LHGSSRIFDAVTVTPATCRIKHIIEKIEPILRELKAAAATNGTI
jgi:hypothetical protein